MLTKRTQRTLPQTAKTVASKNLGIAKIAKARRNGKFRRAFIVKTLYYQLLSCQSTSENGLVKEVSQTSYQLPVKQIQFHHKEPSLHFSLGLKDRRKPLSISLSSIFTLARWL